MKWRRVNSIARLLYLVVIEALLFFLMLPVTPTCWQGPNPVFAQEFYKKPNIVRLPIVTASAVRISPLTNNQIANTSQNTPTDSKSTPFTQNSKNDLTLLEEIRTGYHESYCSMVFQFQNKIYFDGPFVTDGELYLKFKGTTTELDKFSEYTSIHSWLQLKRNKDDIDVTVGVPADFPSYRLILLESPHRLVINFYPDTDKNKASTVLITPVTIPVPTAVSSTRAADAVVSTSEGVETVSPYYRGRIVAVDEQKENDVRETSESKGTEAVSPYFRGKIEEVDGPKEMEVNQASEKNVEGSSLKGSGSGAESPKQVDQGNLADSKGSTGGKGGGFMAIGPPFIQGSNYQVIITPKISIQEEYDDNIFLTKDNTDSDWITTVSPGIGINIESNKNGLELDYTLGWVKYLNNTSNDNIRHSGRLKFWQKLAEHLTFNLEDRYLKSDDIFDEDLTPILPSQRVANNRSRYQKNDATASLEYEFGPRSKFIAGYLYNILDNEDPNQEDVTEKGPFAGLSHWFDNKNSVDFTYRFAEYEYTQEGSSEVRPDIEVQDVGFVYSHRFSERVKPFLAYRLYHQNFMGMDESYWIHNFGAGVGYAFSQKTSFDMFLGGFYPSGNTTATPGMTFRALLNRRFERGSFSLGADTGWDTGFTEVIPRGFTKYYGGLARIDYQLLENLGIYAGADYRQNRYPGDDLDIIGGDTPADDKTYTGRCGLNYRFYRWFSLDLSYTYRQRFSDDPDNEFVDNRFMLRFNAAKPFRW